MLSWVINTGETVDPEVPTEKSLHICFLKFSSLHWRCAAFHLLVSALCRLFHFVQRRLAKLTSCHFDTFCNYITAVPATSQKIDLSDIYIYICFLFDMLIYYYNWRIHCLLTKNICSTRCSQHFTSFNLLAKRVSPQHTLLCVYVATFDTTLCLLSLCWGGNCLLLFQAISSLMLL